MTTDQTINAAMARLVRTRLQREYVEAFEKHPEWLPAGDVIAPNGLPVMGRDEWVEQNAREMMARIG